MSLAIFVRGVTIGDPLMLSREGVPGGEGVVGDAMMGVCVEDWWCVQFTRIVNCKVLSKRGATVSLGNASRGNAPRGWLHPKVYFTRGND